MQNKMRPLTSTSNASTCASLSPPVFPLFSFSYISALRSNAALTDAVVPLSAAMAMAARSRCRRAATPLFVRAQIVPWPF